MIGVRAVRRGQRAADAGGGGDLPRAAASGRHPGPWPTRRRCAAGSTCSTGTARAAPGCSPSPAARGSALGDGRPRPAARRRPVVLQAASLLPDLPRRRTCSADPAPAAAALAERRPTPRAPTSPACSTPGGGRPPAARAAAALRRDLRPRRGSTRSTCPTGPTATPAAAARPWPVQAALPRAAASWSTPRRAARLPAAGARVRRRGRPDSTAGPAAGVPGEPRAAAAGPARQGPPVRRRRRGGLRDPAGPSPRGPAAVMAMAGAGRRPRPSGSSRTTPTAARSPAVRPADERRWTCCSGASCPT